MVSLKHLLIFNRTALLDNMIITGRILTTDTLYEKARITYFVCVNIEKSCIYLKKTILHKLD